MIIEPSVRIKGRKAYYFATKLKEIAAMNADGLDVINLGIGSPDLAPPEEVIDKLKSSSTKKHAHKYQSYYGLETLRSGFATFYKTHFKVNVDSDSEVLPLIGSKEGIMHISMAFLNKGDKVLVPNPGYPAYQVCTEMAGAECIHYELKEENEYLADFEALAKMDLASVKIMWLNYPNMPTGAKASLSYFKNLISFAKKNEILLCHDNPYAFILNEEPLSIHQIEGSKEVSLELTSLSKCFNMAGWRVGAVIGHSDYIQSIIKFKSQMDSGMFKAVQEAATVALEMDASWFKELNAIYTQRREIVYKILDTIGCAFRRDGAGLFVWAKAPEHIKDTIDYVDRILESAKVFITPGDIFGSEGSGYIRISLCSEVGVLEEALERIKKFGNT